MQFTQSLWHDNLELYNQTLNLAFNQELAQGILAKDKFKYYIEQDYLYLQMYSKVLAILSTKAPSRDEANFWLASSNGILQVEAEVHQYFLQTFNSSLAQADNLEMSPTTEHYTSFLYMLATLEPYEIGVAAVLPCFWIYGEVGSSLLKLSKQDNFYQAWINNYAGSDFQTAVKKAIQITDLVASSANQNIRERMRYAYKRSAQLEYMFWDVAYQKQQWLS